MDLLGEEIQKRKEKKMNKTEFAKLSFAKKVSYLASLTKKSDKNNRSIKDKQGAIKEYEELIKKDSKEKEFSTRKGRSLEMLEMEHVFDWGSFKIEDLLTHAKNTLEANGLGHLNAEDMWFAVVDTDYDDIEFNIKFEKDTEFTFKNSRYTFSQKRIKESTSAINKLTKEIASLQREKEEVHSQYYEVYGIYEVAYEERKKAEKEKRIKEARKLLEQEGFDISKQAN